MKFLVRDFTRGDLFQDSFYAESIAEGIEVAKKRWNHMTKHDQENCEEFCLFLDLNDVLIFLFDLKVHSDWSVYDVLCSATRYSILKEEKNG